MVVWMGIMLEEEATSMAIVVVVADAEMPSMLVVTAGVVDVCMTACCVEPGRVRIRMRAKPTKKTAPTP